MVEGSHAMHSAWEGRVAGEKNGTRGRAEAAMVPTKLREGS